MARQASFSAGELAPELWPRGDVPGARRMRNFIPTKSGAAMSRPGTDYLGGVKGSTTVRLIPFIYSDTATEQNYVLEFGVAYIRFWSDGGLVLSGGNPLEVVTDYAEADLPFIRWAQSGDVLTLTCPGHQEKQLSRTSATSWSLDDISFTRPACTSKAVVCTQVSSLADETHPAKEWQWQITTLFRDTKGVLMESAPKTVTLRANLTEWSATASYTVVAGWATHAGHLWAVVADSTNVEPGTDETKWTLDDDGAIQTATAAKSYAIYPDTPIHLILGSGTAPTGDDDWAFVSFRIYRGRSGVMGLVGDSEGGVWTDSGDEPDFAVAPPQGRDPFAVVYPSTSTTVHEHPGAVAYFEERLVFARTDERPAFLWLSGTGDYINFDKRKVPVADEALEFELAARRREEVRSLVGEDGAAALLVFTNGSVWSVSGSGAPISFDNISARVQSTDGASWIQPVVVDGLVLYEAATAGVRGLSYDDSRKGYAGQDISEKGAHLLRGHTITSWAYAAHPWSVLWAVRDDGMLLSLSIDREKGTLGWALHETAGTVEQVCAIPEGREDAVYLVVSRQVVVEQDGGLQAVRYVERLHSRVMAAAVEDNFALDCALTYDGTPISSVTNAGHLLGRDDVYAVADGNVLGPFTVTINGVDDTGFSLGLPADAGASVVHIGLLFQPEMETLDLTPSTRQKALREVAFEVVDSRGLSVGQDFDHLTEWRQRAVSDSYDALAYFTGKVRVQVRGSWDISPRAVVRQTQPLPCTIAALTLEVDGGG